MSDSKIGFLNYGNAETISFPYTATKKGLVIAVGGSTTSGGHIVVNVNGTTVGYYSSNYAGAATVKAYVDIGDTVTTALYLWTINNSYTRFIPFK